MRHSAKWIVIDSETILENGYITVEKGIITDFGSVSTLNTKNIVDHGDGVIIPTLVNTHTHLELSSLKNKISFKSGFQHWVKELISEREKLTNECIDVGIQNAIDELLQSGTSTIGEISSLYRSNKYMNERLISGVFFKEYLGNDLNVDCKLISSQIFNSYAGHAPHTTSPELLKKLKFETTRNNKPYSIHLSESYDETEFIKHGKGKWADFLIERGIDFSSWPVPSRSPVEYLSKLDILDTKTMVVHLINADLKDFKILKDNECKICLCPRSNHNLHRKLPEFELIYNLDLEFCLGTDSLASCETLSIFDEMKYLGEVTNIFSPKTIFKSATINGAKALGLEEQYGDLKPKSVGSFIYLDLEAENVNAVFDKIVNCDFSKSFKVLSPDTTL
ncbi:MAG: amidohydrolase family protein [Desulfobacterales bacterium]|nr:amidohydrolase family protein [Desulfobacterales bacterium]